MPSVPTEKLTFGQSQRVVKRVDRAEQVGQRTDNAEQVGQPAEPEHSCAVGGTLVSRPEGTSHPVISPRTAKGSVDLFEDGLVVTPSLTQEGLEQRVQPVLGDTENSVDSQVELTLLGKPVADIPLQRGAKIRQQPDR